MCLILQLFIDYIDVICKLTREINQAVEGFTKAFIYKLILGRYTQYMVNNIEFLVIKKIILLKTYVHITHAETDELHFITLYLYFVSVLFVEIRINETLKIHEQSRNYN